MRKALNPDYGEDATGPHCQSSEPSEHGCGHFLDGIKMIDKSSLRRKQFVWAQGWEA